MLNATTASPTSFLSELNKAYAILVRDAKLATSYEINFFVQWLGLFVQVVIAFFLGKLVPPSPHFGFGGKVGGYFDYVIVNMAFVGFQSSALQSFARVIREGQLQGTLEVVLSTPTSLSLIVLSGGLWLFTFAFLQTIAYFVFALFFGLNVHHINMLTAVIFFLLMILSLSPFGVIAAATTMALRQTGPINFITEGLAAIFGGLYFPVASLPHPMQIVSWLLPITHSLNGLRAAVSGANVLQVGPDALWLCVASVILLPLSLLAFDRAVHVAKMDGTLGSY